MAKTADQESKSFDEKFPIVRASTLSKEEIFLKHEPKSERQRKLKNLILKGIEVGLKDFRAPALDPSFKGEIIVYKAGEEPALYETPNFWDEELKKIIPEKNSRMGTLLQRAAFLGLLIKYLIEKEGYEVAEAWEAVCDDSKKLGHYCDSSNAKHAFEATGSRKVWEFYDLANAPKIVKDDSSKSGFTRIGGTCMCRGDFMPLADYIQLSDADQKFLFVGWMVSDV